MPERPLCDSCAAPIPPNAHYIVRIDVFADPSIPAMTTEELNEIAGEDAIAKLLDELKQTSADELQDQVHRHFEYKLCRPCQIKFLVNPLGKPRTSSPNAPGKN